MKEVWAFHFGAKLDPIPATAAVFILKHKTIGPQRYPKAVFECVRSAVNYERQHKPKGNHHYKPQESAK